MLLAAPKERCSKGSNSAATAKPSTGRAKNTMTLVFASAVGRMDSMQLWRAKTREAEAVIRTPALPAEFFSFQT